MFTLKIENIKHDILELTHNEGNYQVVSVTGLNPPNAQINRSTVAGMDGAKFNSSKLEERNIVITLKLNGDIEANRINLYRYFNTKQWCKIYYKNESRDVYIEGYVETVECNLFANNEQMQISIICPNPYFKGLEEIVDDVSKVIEMFEFPFAHGSKGATFEANTTTDDAIPFSELDLSKVTNVLNDSESETGMIIEVEFLGTVNKLRIVNTGTGEAFTLNYNFVENDKLVIDTNKGNKSIKLIRNSQEINIFNSLVKGSIFFQLSIGDNYFSYLADNGSSDESIAIRFKHYTIYGGV